MEVIKPTIRAKRKHKKTLGKQIYSLKFQNKYRKLSGKRKVINTNIILITYKFRIRCYKPVG